MTYRQAAEFIVQRRKAELDAAAALFSDALKQNPGLYETEAFCRALILKEAKGEKTDKAAAAALEEKKRRLLKEMGISEQMLAPPPHCKKCSDTAHADGGYCDCVRAAALGGKENLEIPCRAFLEINFDLFDPSHRERNRAIYGDIQKICEKYPHNKRRVITVLGSTGTGKTLLAGCAADAMLKRGFAVAGVTAFGFVNRALRYHTTFDDEKFSHLAPLLESDLLIIDDLGTESVLKNVTHEYLYTVLNERINAGRLTLITSNLSGEGILSRYGTRIYSRIFDKNSGYTNILSGRDMRTE